MLEDIVLVKKAGVTNGMHIYIRVRSTKHSTTGTYVSYLVGYVGSVVEVNGLVVALDGHLPPNSDAFCFMVKELHERYMFWLR